MFKKIMMLVLVLAMTVALFAGCGSTDDSDNNGSQGSNSENASSENGNEPDKLIITYVTFGTTPTELLEVQDLVNDMTIPDINVEVEFKPIAIGDTFTNYSTWIAGGDRIDLMLMVFQDPANYINSGALTPLDDLLDQYGSNITELAKEYPLFDGAVRDGNTYAVSPLAPTYGLQGNIMMRKDWFDETGIEAKDIYTWDDLTSIFASIKDKHPESYPLGAVGNDISTGGSLYNRFGIYGNLGSGVNTGVLMSTDSTEIVNMFAQPEYYDFLVQMREWYEAGYIMTDAATTDSTFIELTTAEITGSAMSYFTTERYADYTQGFGAFGGVEPLRTTLPYATSQAGAEGIYWTIPISAKSPEASMRFLNYLYGSYELENLIQWGIEGKHYQVTDAGTITFAEGLDPTTSGYYNTLGAWGDRRGQYFWSELSTREKNDAFTELALGNKTKAKGYAYDSSEMTNQIVAVNSVLQQYQVALEVGAVADVEGTYNKMLEALEAAGINEIIADNQAQFDAWLAGK